MTPAQLATAGHRLYGRKKWKNKLADALAVNVSTIHRIMHRPEVPGPYEVAVRGLLENKKAIDVATGKPPTECFHSWVEGRCRVCGKPAG